MIKFDRNKLKEQLAYKGITARGLAQETGLSENTIGRILRGENEPKPATLNKIASALGCKREDFFIFEMNGMNFFERLATWQNPEFIQRFLDNADDETNLVFWKNYLCDVFENGARQEAVDGSMKLIKEKGYLYFNQQMKMLQEIKENYGLYMRLDENGEVYIFLPDKEYDHMKNVLGNG